MDLRHLSVNLNYVVTHEIPNDCSLFTFKHTVPAHEEQRAREGGLRIWTAQETECVLEVG